MCRRLKGRIDISRGESSSTLNFLDRWQRKRNKKFSIVGVLAMANSRSTAPLGVGSLRRGPKVIPARTPGPLGRLDAGDPDIRTKSGDTPRSVGVRHQTSNAGKLATYDDM